MDTANKENIPNWAIANNVTRFFYVFSKLEHALKRNKFLQDTKEAKASWHLLADKLDESFFQSMKKAPSTQIIFRHPPKKQINQNGQLSWENKAAPQNTKELLEALLRVRNNLFHGGKYPSEPIEEPSRNDELLCACLFVMNGIIQNEPNILMTFIEPTE